MINKLKFHHFGLAVNSFDKAILFYKQMGYRCTDPIVDEQQNVELVMCDSDDFPSVELIKPISNESPIVSYLKKNNEIIYHTCYVMTDVDIKISELFPENRIVLISDKKKAILFNNRLVSFYYVQGVGIIEILH